MEIRARQGTDSRLPRHGDSRPPKHGDSSPPKHGDRRPPRHGDSRPPRRKQHPAKARRQQAATIAVYYEAAKHEHGQQLVSIRTKVHTRKKMYGYKAFIYNQG